VQRKQPAILVKSLELAVIARIFHAKRTGESVLPNPAGRLSHLFLREASEQSAFKDSIRRMQYDHKPMKSWGIGPFTFTEFAEEIEANQPVCRALTICLHRYRLANDERRTRGNAIRLLLEEALQHRAQKDSGVQS
jgi:hypothetical protein